MATDLEKRFSLEFLPSGINVSGANQPATAPAPGLGESALQQAISAYTGPILSILAGVPEVRLFDLFDQLTSRFPALSIDMSAFQQVMQWMIKNELVNVVTPDRHGNDLVAFSKRS